MQLLNRRRYAGKHSSEEERVWVLIDTLRQLPNCASIPIYATACRNLKYTSSSCRIGLSYSPHDELYYQYNNPWPADAPYIYLENYNSPSRISFQDKSVTPNYDSGWYNYYSAKPRETITAHDGTVYYNCSTYYNDDIEKLWSGDIFGPAPVYVYMYQKYTGWQNYLCLIDSKYLNI